VTDSPGPCPRCVFRPCGYTGPGAAWCEVRMPDGRVTRGQLCAAHTVLLSARPAFGVTVLNEEEGPCGWLVPAEEAAACSPPAAPGPAPDLQEVPG
jgi:hypothetical protein